MEEGEGIAHPQTQYEEMRDGNMDHLKHQEQDDLLATQAIRRRRLHADEMIGENHAAHNGILEQITCVNFMCHEYLKVELGPLMNFIVGENGSGKSAVLTAITLCLGGKATSTNRGGSLKNFIKEGCDRAILIVEIKNQGEDAYRRDLYGDKIRVERHFSKTGASGFKVKSETDRVVSTKKSEVDEIVEYYALQVDNPLNVLSQDNARQFLNASTAAQKYKYFIEGVQLEQLDRDYRLVLEFLEQSEAKTPLQADRVKALKAEKDRAHKAFEAAQKSQQSRLRLKVLRNQIIWAQVAHEEQMVARQDEKIVAKDQEIAHLEEQVATSTTQLERHDALIEENSQVLEAARQEEAKFETDLAVVKDGYEEARKTMEKLHAEERNAYTEANTANNNCAELKASIEQEMQRLEEANGDKPIQLRKALDQANVRRTEMEEEVATLKETEKELEAKARATEGKCTASQAALKDSQQAIQQQTAEINSTKRGIDMLRNGQGGRYDAYPQGMAALVAAIEKHNGFKDKPVGPIGAHVQLLKPEWSAILEKQLGGLNDFIVTNLEDQKQLKVLISEAFRRERDTRNHPGIIITRARNLDTTGKEPDERFDTILRVLKIDNDAVRSSLIINNMIEQIILIEDRVEAQEVMFNGPLPRNVKMCFCHHDGKRNHGLMLMNKGGGSSLTTNPITPNPGQQPRMKTDMDAQIKAQQDTLRHLQQELRDFQSRREQLQQEHDSNLTELAQQKRQLQETIRAWKKLENDIFTVVDVEIRNIERELDQFEGADSRLDGLKQELKILEDKQQHYATQYAELHIRKESFNAEVDARKAALRAARSKKPEIEKKVQDAENKVERLRASRKIALEEKNNFHEELDVAKMRKEELLQDRARMVADVESFTRTALEQVPERAYIPEGETHASISAQFESLSRQVREAEKRRGISDKEAKRLFEEATAAYSKAEADLKILQKINRHMRKTLESRLAKWRLFQRIVTAHARNNFARLLSERNYRGQLLIDHERHLLQLRVETEKTAKNAGGKNTKSLSGGEKSFSSICLLLAIWDAMGSPLRCLDEFDVFMDNVNRAISTNMLISAARQSHSRQFILITPNAIEGRAKLEKDVKIIRYVCVRVKIITQRLTISLQIDRSAPAAPGSSLILFVVWCWCRYVYQVFTFSFSVTSGWFPCRFGGGCS